MMGQLGIDSRIVSCKPKNGSLNPSHDEVTSQIRYLGLALGRVKDWFWSRLAFKSFWLAQKGSEKK